MTDAIVVRSNSVSRITSPQFDFILLDGSGSMYDKWWPMLGAIDAYVAGLRIAQIDSHILLVEFDDTDAHLPVRDTPIAGWKTFDVEPIGAHFGGTPLYDAIVLMGQKIRELNPNPGAVTIVTDGQDTGDKFADINQARAVLDWLRDLGWSVTFIGCDFDNSRQAKALGANPSNSIGVRKELLTDATREYAKKRARHARDGQGVSFTDDEKQKFGGYLTGGK